jgi:hypothetical protein
MTEINQDETLYAGDYYVIEIPIYDEDDVLISVGDLSTLRYIIAANQNSAALVTKNLSAGITLSDSDRQVDVELLEADTLALQGRYYHALRGEDASGKPVTLMTGRLKIFESGVSMA